MAIELFTKKITQRVVRAFGFVGSFLLFTLPTVAYSENIEVSFSYPANANIPSISVKDCTFMAPAANGAELVYNCPAQPVYEVSFKNVDTDTKDIMFGAVEIRNETFSDTVMFAPIYHVALLKPSADAALTDFNAFEDGKKPLIEAGEIVVAVKEEDTTGAKTVAAAPAVPKPEKPKPAKADLVEIPLTWSAAYGALQVNWEITVNEASEANGMISGVLRWDPSMRNKFVLSSARAENCSQIYSVKQLQENGEIAFDCEEQLVSLPLTLPLGESACRVMGEGQLSCLSTGEGQGVSLAVDGWNTVVVPTAAEGEVSAITLADLKAKFPSDVVMENVRELSEDQCTPKKVSLHLGGYCQGDLCESLGDNAPVIGSSGYLPDLGSIGWSKDALPTGAQLILKETNNEGSIILADAKVSFPVASQSVRALFSKTGGGGNVKLTVAAEGEIYKFGRVMKVFKDDQCNNPAGSNSLNLANPGNRTPDVPQCSFYRIFDGDTARSSCTQIEYDAVAKTATANLEVDGCGNKRLVVLVSENESMNGIVGQSIVSALTNLAARFHSEEKCLPVDLVRASGEKREILLSAEDMKFSDDPSKFQASVTMSFVNGNSEILRDFEWINRKWDRTLSGLIAVVDGDNASPTSMVDSPASMAWKIEDKYRSVINFGASKNCNVFQDILLYDACSEGDAATFEAVLTENIEQGLARIQAASE